MAEEIHYKDHGHHPTNLRMHPTNPFFNSEARRQTEPSTIPTLQSNPEEFTLPSTNPFRRARNTPTPMSHAEEDHPIIDLLTGNASLDPDLDSDPEIPQLVDTATPVAEESQSTPPMPESPQGSTADQRVLSSTASVRVSHPAVENIPAAIRAPHSGRRGLNLHVHWGDEGASGAGAASSSSSSSPDPHPSHNNEQAAATATTTIPEQPDQPPAQPPADPPNHPPTAPAAPQPGANPPNMFIYQQPNVAYQAPMPVIMTNPTYVMPQQTPPYWGPWLYPKHCPSPFWAGNVNNRPIFPNPAFSQVIPTAPIYPVGPQNTYYVFH